VYILDGKTVHITDHFRVAAHQQQIKVHHVFWPKKINKDAACTLFFCFFGDVWFSAHLLRYG